MATTRKTMKSATKTVKTEPKVEAPVQEEPVVEETFEEKVEQAAVSKPKKVNRKPDDTIETRSVTAGELIYIGPKTHTIYKWANMGDTAWVEYQDLLSAVTARSNYVLKPLFVIEDEEVLDDIRFAEIKELYDSMVDIGDVKQLIDNRVTPREFRKKFERLPIGLKNAVKAEVSKGIMDGTFDSLQKVKIIDEICHTDLAQLL